jgi:BON domain-containing protein
MNTKYSFKLIVPAVLFGMVLSVPSFAQDNAPASAQYNNASAADNPNAPAGQQMRDAGREMKDAGSDTTVAAEDAFHGTTRAVKDTTITAEVKTALERDKEVRASRIRVETSAGIVTLKGNVPSPDMAAYAAQLAGKARGVRSVNNQLLVANTTAAE